MTLSLPHPTASHADRGAWLWTYSGTLPPLPPLPGTLLPSPPLAVSFPFWSQLKWDLMTLVLLA